MEKNEVKKEIYKQNPLAILEYIRKGKAFYSTSIAEMTEDYAGTRTLLFEVPVSDMGDADFTPRMMAKLLIRWLQ